MITSYSKEKEKEKEKEEVEKFLDCKLVQPILVEALAKLIKVDLKGQL